MNAAVNPYAERLADFVRICRRRRLDVALVFDRANIRSLTGVDSDNACLRVAPSGVTMFTDFRYLPMVHRVAPWLKTRDIRRLDIIGRRVGYEGGITHSRYEKLVKDNRRAAFVDVQANLRELRAVKTAEEIARIRLAERETCRIWNESSRTFSAGMTELDMARVIRHAMIDAGGDEAFETIVCVGANAAECHHVPDGTVWNGRDAVLVDMGLRLDGYCADLTRNLLPRHPSTAYSAAYRAVREANAAAIAALMPGMTSGQLDRVARKVIREHGFGRCFGHALGHGVGLEIHEAPSARRGDKTVLKAGMLVTVEPGVYLEGNLGVRIEDLVLVTDTGSEVLSSDAAVPEMPK